MNFLDKLRNFINEASQGYTHTENQLKGFKAVDRPVRSYSYTGSVNSNGVVKQQVDNQIGNTKEYRDYIFSRIDLIRNNHLAITIKDIIVGDGFNSMCDKSLMTIRYNSPDKSVNKLFNDSIQKMLDKTCFIEVFKDCLINEGLDYGEMFLSTVCKYGKGIVEINDDVDVKQHIALYKNLKPIGVVRFPSSDDSDMTYSKKISANRISHFLVSPRKINIKIKPNFKEEITLPEKIRCAVPLLASVVDLILHYNVLEQISTAVELARATSPILLGVGIEPMNDQTSILDQLQNYEIALNSNRETLLDNLSNLDVSAITSQMNKISLIPYSSETGTNNMKQIVLDFTENNLSEKINDARVNIAQSVGVPVQNLATSTIITDKGDSIATDPRYSRLLSGIQQSLGNGVQNFIEKHLSFRFTRQNGTRIREVNKEYIEVKFNSTTSVADKLDMEQMLLTANTIDQILTIIDNLAGSPNIPVKTSAQAVITLWKKSLEKYPFLSDTIVEDELAIKMHIDDGSTPYDDKTLPTDNKGFEEEEQQEEQNSENPDKDLETEKDIRDVFE